MSITPYTPTPFSTPVANPAIGGTGTPYPYVSVSQFNFAPTGVDTNDLVVGGSGGDSTQALANTLRDASGWADRICMGADPAAKGASLCATLSVETGQFPVLHGELRLVCDYKPIIQVNGIDIGPIMGSLSTIGPSMAQNIRIGRRTIYVPIYGIPFRNNDVGNPNLYYGTNGTYIAVWSYVNGYPHSQLVDSIAAGTDTCVLQPTDGATGLLGIIPGVTQMTIVDGADTETFTVSAISGTTLTSAVPFQNNHTIPESPDFLPVTCLPSDVGRAVIFIATALIKSEGDASMVLAEMSEPKSIQKTSGDMPEDLRMAMELLKPFRIRVKAKN